MDDSIMKINSVLFEHKITTPQYKFEETRQDKIKQFITNENEYIKKTIEEVFMCENINNEFEKIKNIPFGIEFLESLMQIKIQEDAIYKIDKENENEIESKNNIEYDINLYKKNLQLENNKKKKKDIISEIFKVNNV